MTDDERITALRAKLWERGELHSFELVSSGTIFNAWIHKSDATVDWTGAQLKRLGVTYLLAGHCTGIEATFRLRRAIGLSRKTAPVSSVGSSFTLGKGIYPGDLAA